MKRSGVLLLLALPSVISWGAAGHEIVATIAEIHLFPSTREEISFLLPEGRLAPIASWADKIKFANRWSSSLHYVNSAEDYPPENCSFPGESGWTDDRNILTAIGNYTERLSDKSFSPAIRSEALKFLVHFLGDIHQPLHIAGRDKGGNQDPIRWGGRHTNLHSLWDGLLIARALRDLNNYTSPLPSDQIENSLRGAIYDPYIRWILWEGVRDWWKDDLSDWLECGDEELFHSSSSGYQIPLIFSSSTTKPNHHPNLYESCSLSWSKLIHESVTCPLAFPPPPYSKDQKELPDLSKGWYDEVKKGKTLEKLLAMGGVRLAWILNQVLADEEDWNRFGKLVELV